MRVEDQEVFDLLKNEHNEESLRKKPYCVILEEFSKSDLIT